MKNSRKSLPVDISRELSDSQVDQLRAAKAYLCNFLKEHIELDMKEFLNQEDVKLKSLLGSLCNYLVESTEIGFNTAMQYLSQIKKFIELETPGSRIFDHIEWYKSIRAKLRRKYIEKSI
jgi:hypothetical protein